MKDTIIKSPYTEAGDVVQLAECWLVMHEALGSTSSTT